LLVFWGNLLEVYTEFTGVLATKHKKWRGEDIFECPLPGAIYPQSLSELPVLCYR